MDDKVYKCVAAYWVDDQIVLTSAMTTMHGPYMVEYLPKRKVYPVLEGSYLYAFKDRAVAEHWIDGTKEILKPQIEIQVWEARAHIICDPAIYTVNPNIGPFWNEHMHANPYAQGGLMVAKDSAVWCDWIELVSLIKGFNPEKPTRERKK